MAVKASLDYKNLVSIYFQTIPIYKPNSSIETIFSDTFFFSNTPRTIIIAKFAVNPSLNISNYCIMLTETF